MRTALLTILTAVCFVGCASTSTNLDDAEEAIRAERYEDAHRIYVAAADAQAVQSDLDHHAGGHRRVDARNRKFESRHGREELSLH